MTLRLFPQGIEIEIEIYKITCNLPELSDFPLLDSPLHSIHVDKPCSLSI